MPRQPVRDWCVRSLGLWLAGSLAILAGCSGADELKNLVQLKELPPEAGVALASMRFDAGTPVQVRGPVTTLLFAKPGTTGAIVIHTTAGEKYVFATAATPVLARQGFSRFSLQPGQEVIVTGVRAEGARTIDGLQAARADGIATADGRRLFDRAALPTVGPQ